MLSGIVGDRCDVRYRYSDGHAGKYHTAKSMNVLFENLNRRAMTDIRVNDLGKDTHQFYDTPIDTNIMHERIRRQIQLRAEQLPQAQLNKDTQGGPYMTKGFEWTAANGDTLSRAFHVRIDGEDIHLSRTDTVTYIDQSKAVPLEVEYKTEYEGASVYSTKDALQDKLPDVGRAIDRWMMLPPSRTATLPKELEAVRDFRLTDASEHLTDLVNIASERLSVATEMIRICTAYTVDTAIAVSDKFDPNLFQNGVHVDVNGNVTRLAENWEEILADLNASDVQL